MSQPPAPPPTTLRVSLCLLVWNEARGCRLDVPRMPLHAFDEVYAIDGGSTDGTREYLLERSIPVHVQRRKGYNAAIIEAFERCTTDAVVLFHPKGAVDPLETLACRRMLHDGHDLAIASRLMPGGRNEEDSRLLRPRKWFVRALALASWMLWNADRAARPPLVRDVLHGFRGMRRDAFFAIDPLPTGLSIDLEMVVRGYRKGLRMGEFSSREAPRPFGDTHFAAWSTGKRLLAYLAHELRRPA